MNVTFYNATFNRKRVQKALPSGTTITASVKDVCDLHDPVIRLVHDASHVHFNYAYVPDFGRYYYVDPPEIDGKEDIFYLHVDQLMSFANDIKASKGIATRSQYYNKNIADSLVMLTESEKVRYRKLSAAITGGTYVAIIGGK